KATVLLCGPAIMTLPRDIMARRDNTRWKTLDGPLPRRCTIPGQCLAAAGSSGCDGHHKKALSVAHNFALKRGGMFVGLFALQPLLSQNRSCYGPMMFSQWQDVHFRQFFGCVLDVVNVLKQHAALVRDI